METFVEPLEDRIAPATLLNPTTLVYTDVDGDTVTVKVSKGDLAGRFFMDPVNDGITAAEQLERLDLNDPIFDGASLTISAKPSEIGGDGFANVGFVNAVGTAMGKVKIDGDLAKIVAGNASKKDGLKSLEVQSMGEYATTTGAPDLNTVVEGNIPKFIVKGNLNQVSVELSQGGGIKSMDVHGSLIGGATTWAGSIRAEGSISKLTIHGNVIGSSASGTGYIDALDGLGTVDIGGNVVGGTAVSSGVLTLANKIHVHGNVVGGTSGDTGQISGKTVNIDGALVGGVMERSGIVAVVDGAKVTIGQDIVGGDGMESGAILGETAKIDSITVKGDVIGGDGISAGSIKVDSVKKSISIDGNLQGGTDNFAGVIYGNSFGKISIGGSLIGHSTFLGDPSGGIYASLKIKEVSIKGSVEGAYGRAFIVAAGEIGDADATIGKVTVGGNVSNLDLVTGYSINEAGAFTGTNGDASIGVVKVSGNWTASNIAAGMETSSASQGFAVSVTNLIPGSATTLSSWIGSITIGGQAAGVPGAMFTTAFVAQQGEGVPSFKIAKKTYEFASATEVLSVGSTYYAVTDKFNFLAYMKA